LLVAVVVMAVVGTALMWWLLSVAASDPAASVRFDAVRMGLAAAVATGGAFALLLAFRRQRCTEVSALHMIIDASQRRATELYATAADQLGSEQAPVRLAGLYALERLAQDNPPQRQHIVNVICAYLQMPYVAPGPLPVDPPADDPPPGRRARNTAGTAGPGAQPLGDQERERYERRALEHGRRTQEQRSERPPNGSSPGIWPRPRPRTSAGTPRSICPGPTSPGPTSPVPTWLGPISAGRTWPRPALSGRT
jgi:hypothetical protein